MKNNKYHTVDGTVPKSNRKIIEGGKINAQDKKKKEEEKDRLLQ